MVGRPRHRVAALAAVAVLTAGAASAARAENEATCARDVLIAQSMQRQAIEQLETAGDDQANQCRVWRRHVDTMRRIAGVYGRCLSGPERKERLDQVQGSESEFGDLVRSRCKGR